MDGVRTILLNVETWLLTHAVLSLLASIYFAQNGYNVAICVMGLWANNILDSTRPTKQFLELFLFTAIMDITVLAVYSPYDHTTGGVKYCVAMMCISLILKPITMFLFWKKLKDRGEDFGHYFPHFGQEPAESGGHQSSSVYEHVEGKSDIPPPATVTSEGETYQQL